MPEVWTPGAPGPLDQFVERLHRRIAAFGESNGLEEVGVEFELSDGSLWPVKRVFPEPGFGFVTLCPHGDEPQELVIPLTAIRQIKLGRPEPSRSRFGFSVPSA